MDQTFESTLSTGRADKLVVVDDDPVFGALLMSKAKSAGFDARFFLSLVDMGSFARIKDYDLAVIDFYMDQIRGDEIAAYVDTFFKDIPVIIVSAEDFSSPERRKKWPPTVRAFVQKTDGVDKILATAKAVLHRERMLRRLSTTTRPC